MLTEWLYHLASKTATLLAMIIAIDIGGTKTLVATCKKDGTTAIEQRFETPKNYKDFIKELTKAIDTLPKKDISLTVVAVPGKLDRKNGIGIAFGNLDWKNVPIASDIKKITNTKVLIENDANLAGLSEVHNIKPLPHRALYLTFSTGIGSGFITKGSIDPDLVDSEAGQMLFVRNNKLEKWESFASGKAIVTKYGKRASDITDQKAWQEIAHNFAIGIVDICAVMELDIIIIGGGVGSHYKKYGDFLTTYIAKIASPLISIPKIIQAKQPEQAVIFGCIILANQHEQH